MLVSQEAKHCEGNEGTPQALGTASSAYAGAVQDMSVTKNPSLPPSWGIIKVINQRVLVDVPNSSVLWS